MIGEGDFDESDESEPTGSSAFDLASLGTYFTITGPAWDRVTRPEEGPGSAHREATLFRLIRATEQYTVSVCHCSGERYSVVDSIGSTEQTLAGLVGWSGRNPILKTMPT